MRCFQCGDHVEQYTGANKVDKSDSVFAYSRCFCKVQPRRQIEDMRFEKIDGEWIEINPLPTSKVAERKMNNAFSESVRRHTHPTHQLVREAHGVLDFSYAWSAEEAQKYAEICAQLHGKEPEIYKWGEFIPDYTDDIDVA